MQDEILTNNFRILLEMKEKMNRFFHRLLIRSIFLERISQMNSHNVCEDVIIVIIIQDSSYHQFIKTLVVKFTCCVSWFFISVI